MKVTEQLERISIFSASQCQFNQFIKVLSKREKTGFKANYFFPLWIYPVADFCVTTQFNQERSAVCIANSIKWDNFVDLILRKKQKHRERIISMRKN